MSTDSEARYNGPLIVDVTALKDDIVDLAPRSMMGLKREKPNFDAAQRELVQAKAGALDKVGIAGSVVDRIVMRTDKLAALRVQRGIAAKLVEVLEETEAYFEDMREGDIAVVAKAVQTAAKHIDKSVLASFEAMLSYYSQNADKAAATRRKNAKAEEQEPGNPDPES
jgi:hypothetical protein